MCDPAIYLILIVVAAIALFIFLSPTREGYREPIYLNRKKMLCDWYPRANGSIYGPYSNLLSGFPYYDKAY